MERPRALYILEGASGSRRRDLAEALTDDGFVVKLGMPSQYPERNRLLTPESQAILAGVDLNFKRVLQLTAPEGKDIAERCIKVVSLEFAEGVRLMNEGNVVFLNSSAPRLANMFWMASALAERYGDEELAKLSYKMVNKAMEAITLVDTVTGFVLMSDIYRGAGRNGTSMADLEEMESVYLQRTVLDIKFKQGFPVCLLDPNNYSLEAQIRRVREFTTKP